VTREEVAEALEAGRIETDYWTKWHKTHDDGTTIEENTFLNAIKLCRMQHEALMECKVELDDYYRAEYPSDHPYHVKKREAALKYNPANAVLALWPEEETTNAE